MIEIDSTTGVILTVCLWVGAAAIATGLVALVGYLGWLLFRTIGG